MEDDGWDSTPTPAARVCPDCAGRQVILADFVPPPRSYDEAWGIPSCCGTGNPDLWRWCRGTGEVTEKSRGAKTSYAERRNM